jgi:uncharacterized protein (DUF427 family)
LPTQQVELRLARKVEEAVMKALWKSTVLAESDETIVVEGNHYFPPDSVVMNHLQPSAKRTTCPWKGVASYYDVEVDGERLEAAAWVYPEPKPAARQISGYVAFWKGVKVVASDELDELDEVERRSWGRKFLAAAGLDR